MHAKRIRCRRRDFVGWRRRERCVRRIVAGVWRFASCVADGCCCRRDVGARHHLVEGQPQLDTPAQPPHCIRRKHRQVFNRRLFIRSEDRFQHLVLALIGKEDRAAIGSHGPLELPSEPARCDLYQPRRIIDVAYRGPSPASPSSSLRGRPPLAHVITNSTNLGISSIGPVEAT